jgi:hypothetical protein
MSTQRKTIYNRLRIWTCVLFLTAVAGIAGPDLGLMGLVTTSVMEDTPLSLPFEIPLQINDSSLLFPNADSVKTFRYSGGEEILVYQYHSFKTAVKDMENFSSGIKERVTKQESSIMRNNNMVIVSHKEKGLSGGFFILDTYIVGILAKEGLQSREMIIHTGEGMVTAYNKYLANFHTPEKCIDTLIRAIGEMDINMVMHCFNLKPTLMENSYKNMMLMSLNARKIAMEQTGRLFPTPAIKIGRVETISDTEARVEISKGASELPFADLIPHISQIEVWLPLNREGRKWAIDMGKLMELSFAYSRKHAGQQTSKDICMNNLKQIGCCP